MSFATARTDVDDTATVIFNTGKNRQGWPASNILLKNTHATETLYVGEDDTVSTASGFPVGPGELMAVASLGPADVVYGITAGTTVSVAVISQLP